MSAITTHVLDSSRGVPAAGVEVELEYQVGADWRQVGRGATDRDGRLRTLMPEGTPPQAGAYRLTFRTAEYFAASNTATFYPRVVIEFIIAPGESHYHVPLLLSPFGYTTYRGT